MNTVLEFLTASRPVFLADLAALLNVDCGTHNKAGVDRAGEWVEARCAEWGREAGRTRPKATHELGFDIKDVTTGGASDANLLAARGVPVLDGLGPVGGLDHGPDEYIEADSLVPRTAMVARLIQRIVSEKELKELRELSRVS